MYCAVFCDQSYAEIKGVAVHEKDYETPKVMRKQFEAVEEFSFVKSAYNRLEIFLNSGHVHIPGKQLKYLRNCHKIK